jgi:hypothetical protein
MSLSIAASLGIRATETVASDLSSARDLLNLTFSQEFTDGTGNNQCDKIFHDQRTLPGGFTEDLDLYGSLTGKLSTAVINFAKIKLIYIKNTSATLTLTLGGSTNPLVNWVGASGDLVKIPPGGVLFLTAPLAGFAVTAATGDILTVSSSGACTYDIVLAGSTA